MTVLAVLVFVAITGDVHGEDKRPKDSADSPTAGQPETRHTPEQDSPLARRLSDRIQYVGPDTYILLDAAGRPQPVPGMTYEDFLAAWKKLNQATTPESQPRFTIESIKIDGRTHGQRAELKFQAIIHLITDDSVNVPLGLVGAILQGVPHFGSPDAGKPLATSDRPPPENESRNEYLDFDPQHGGIVAHMNGKANERRLLSFDLIVPLLRDGEETTLPLSCPRSVSSSLALVVDSPIAEARSNTGAVITKQAAAEGGSRIEVAGPAGQFRLTWQAANHDSASVASVLNAVGAIHVAIDGRGVRSDARLTVRSFGGTFDQFRVRLPRGAKLIRDPAATGGQDPKYRISEEAKSASAATKIGDEAGQVILVELKEKQQGPVVVDISTEQSISDINRPLDLAGFEVLGAVRQYGDIGLNVASDWQARWTIGRDIRQVDPADLESSSQRSDLTAAFQYDGQPWSLDVRISPRPSRVHVTPKYEMELLPEEARLTVRLAYQNLGARAFEFRVETDGWEMSGEPLESGGLVDQERVTVTPDGTLILPLAQASSRKAEVTFSLRRTLDRDASMLQLPMPVPSADSVGTGELTVRVPAESEILPDLANSTGLAASPAPAAVGASEAATELHFRCLLPNSVFFATRANRRREITAQPTARIEIGPDVAKVDQRIDYAVRYEPIKELLFDASGDLPTDEDGVEIALLSSSGGNSDAAEQRTPLHVELISNDDELSPAGTRRLRAVLPQAQVGKFAVGVRYRIARPQTPATSGILPVSLLAPVDVQVASERALVATSRGISVSLSTKADDASWKVNDSQPRNNSLGAAREFVAERAELILPLLVSASESKPQSATIVERAWLQTWISGDIEQDRAAFRLRTSNSQTTVELPPDAPPGEVEVLVDSQPAEIVSQAAGRMVVRLAPDAPNPGAAVSPEPGTHTLEVRFRQAIQQPLLTRHLLTPPQIDATTQLSQIYWQIVLPGDEHIVQSPEQLTSASEWQWLGSFWGRRPVMSQAELEAWVGASSQVAPAAADNQYLFTGLLPVSSISLLTAPRWLIVLVASSATLAILLGWYYLPTAIRSWLLIALIFAIAFTTLAYPTAAMLVGQASAIGVVLAMLSMLISRLLARPARRLPRSTFTASSQRMSTPRTDSILMSPAIASASTAPTAILRSSDSER